MSGDSARWAIRAVDLEWNLVDGEVVILDLKTSLYQGLNGPGSVCWQQIAAAGSDGAGVDLGGATAAGLSDRLVATYDIPLAQARADVDALLTQLADAGLIVPVAP